MKYFFKKLVKILPIVACAFLVGITNWIPGTILSGGDNLHPEFDFGLNIQRSLFGVWQEYQGVGLLGGMGHSADLIRQLFLWSMSAFIDTNFLRFFWTILMQGVGGIGAYKLFSYISGGTSDKNKYIAALGAGSYYMLNIGTLQSFYIPFEVFTAHFGFLPWLILATIKFIKDRSWFTWWVLVFVMILSAPSGVVPTLFLVYWIVTLALVIFFNFGKRAFFGKGLITLICIVIAFILTNGYWLFNFLYFTFVNSAVNVGSRINQMSTNVIYLQNKEYGDLGNILWQKSFWFSGIEPNINNVQSYIMQPWINHLNNPIVMVFQWILIGMVLGGLFLAVFKSKLWKAIAFLWIVLFSFLATNTFPFEQLNILLRDHLPLFGQIFRFTFTKFSIAFSLFNSLLLGLFIYWLIKRTVGQYGGMFARLIVILIYIGLISVTVLPTFQGEFFYNRVQVSQPNKYQDVFEYFKNEPYDRRIANFPQHSFWSWQYNDWGYAGSGFLWYGINQPIMDRAFDPWSGYSENYHSEISEAVYGRNPELLKAVLNKYQIGYILIDRSVVDNFSAKVTYYPELIELISETDGISKDAEFGNILIYKVDLKNGTNNFVRVSPSLPLVNGYDWTTQDKAFLKIGDYVSATEGYTYYFPYRNLVKHKSNINLPVEISESDREIILSSSLKGAAGTLDFNNWFDDEIRTMYKISVVKDQNVSKIVLELLMPSLYIDGEMINKTLVYPIANFSEKSIINTSVGENFEIDSVEYVSYGYLLNDQDLEIVVKDSDGKAVSSNVISIEQIKAESKLATIDIDKAAVLSIHIPKYLDPRKGLGILLPKLEEVDCQNFSKGESSAIYDKVKSSFDLMAEDTKVCLSQDFSAMWHNQGYVAVVDTNHKSGLPIQYWVENNDSDYHPTNQYLKTGNQFLTVAPANDFGLGYSFHFDNLSIGDEISANSLLAFKVYPIPYNWMTNLVVSERREPVNLQPATVDVTKQNISYYEVYYKGTDKNQVVILEQSFDNGWVMYDVGPNPNWFAKTLPMLFGKKIEEHVEVNNLVNGWAVRKDSDTRFVIVYVPQYLQYFGYILLIGVSVFGIIWLIGYFSGRVTKDLNSNS